jgi:hypothetical protein
LSRCFKEVLDRKAAISPDGRVVVLVLPIRGRKVEAAVARDALEEHFWLPPGADAACTIQDIRKESQPHRRYRAKEVTCAAWRTAAADRERLRDSVIDRWLTMTVASR